MSVATMLLWSSLSIHTFFRMFSTSKRLGRSASSGRSAETVAGPCSPLASMRRPAGNAHTLPSTFPSHSRGSSYPSLGLGRGFAMNAANTKRSSISSAHMASWPFVVVVTLASSMAYQCAKSAWPSSQPERSASAQRRTPLSSTISLQTVVTCERLTRAWSAAPPPATFSASASSSSLPFFFSSTSPLAWSASARSTSRSSGFAQVRGCFLQYSRKPWSAVCATTPSAASLCTSGFGSWRKPRSSEKVSSVASSPASSPMGTKGRRRHA
mmetsp:Transcript_57551/g.162324  ORF Transcript_57551/g.162324 Transcript_57551/m.162324 type:complete len:269 (-) Transcript_57551:21-827(-)